MGEAETKVKVRAGVKGGGSPPGRADGTRWPGAVEPWWTVVGAASRPTVPLGNCRLGVRGAAATAATASEAVSHTASAASAAAIASCITPILAAVLAVAAHEDQRAEREERVCTVSGSARNALRFGDRLGRRLSRVQPRLRVSADDGILGAGAVGAGVSQSCRYRATPFPAGGAPASSAGYVHLPRA